MPTAMASPIAPTHRRVGSAAADRWLWACPCGFCNMARASALELCYVTPDARSASEQAFQRGAIIEYFNAALAGRDVVTVEPWGNPALNERKTNASKRSRSRNASPEPRATLSCPRPDSWQLDVKNRAMINAG